jgi:hypothetical protein
MGLRDAFKSKGARELDAERLVDRFERLQLTHLADVAARNRVTVCGEVKRMTIKPRSGIPSTEIVINDGTGEATVIFSGRRHVTGIEHGRCLVVDGVPFAERSSLVFLNPAYTLLPHSAD